MTIDQIDALAPGREADRLFAEHALGWAGFYQECVAGLVGFPPNDLRWESVGHYSTRTIDALAAIDAWVRASNHWQSWEATFTGKHYEVCLWDYGAHSSAAGCADTLALAIVRCCLKAAMGGEQ